MAGETQDEKTLGRLRSIENVSSVVGTAVLSEEVRIGRTDEGDTNAQRHARMGARVMLDSLEAVGVEIPTELLNDESFQTNVIPVVAQNDAIRPTADQIEAAVDQVVTQVAEEGLATIP